MSYRSPVRASIDSAVFKNTADRTKRINVSPTIMRGGIRL